MSVSLMFPGPTLARSRRAQRLLCVGLLYSALLYLALGATGSWAASPPKITGLAPQGGQRGTTVTVQLFGDNLPTAGDVIFSGDSGLTATIVPATDPLVSLLFSGGGVTTARGNTASLTIDVAIGEDAACGRRELRVVTAGGVSNAIDFHVGDLPELKETEPNDSPETATVLELPGTISGAIGRGADVDHLRFKAEKGQRLIFEVYAQRIGSRLDSNIALLGSNGEVLAENEDANGIDSMIDFTAPEDGEYILRIRDTTYKGSSRHTYRINAGVLPYLDSIFPPGARRGTEADLKLIGRNLGSVSSMRIALAADARAGRREVRAATSAGLSNPVPFFVGSFPETMDKEPNNTPEEAQAVSSPININGRIGEPGDVDLFKLNVEAGQTLRLDVLASRLGSPLDPLLQITKADGTRLALNDDAAGADARIDFRFPEKGEYTIRLNDLLDRGGEAYIYRLSIFPRNADFGLTFRPDTPSISRGGRTVVGFSVSRTAGFRGPVSVTLLDPPEGISADPVLVNARRDNGFITLSATKEAPLGVKPFRLAATAALGGAQALRRGSPRGESRGVREAFLTVTEEPPFLLDFVTLTAGVEQAKSTSLEVAIRRRPGFTEAVRLSVQGLPDRSSAPEVTIASDENRATIKVNAQNDAQIAERMIYVRGRTRVGNEDIEQITATIPFSARETPFMLTASLPRVSLTALPEGSESAASVAVLTIKVARRGWFTDEVTLEIEGLPEGVAATIENIARGSGEAKITLKASEGSATEEPGSLKITGKATINGRDYTQQAAAVQITVTPPTETPTETPVEVASDSP